MRRLAVVLAAIALPVALAHAAGPTTVTASGASYTPKSVTIPVGGTVTWKNGGGNHNVVFDDGSYRSGDPTTKDDIGQRTFDTAGTFVYHCQVHGAEGGLGMSGTVMVGDGGVTNPDPTATPTAEPTSDGPQLSGIAIKRTLSHGRLRGSVHATPDGAKLTIAVTRNDASVGRRTATTHGDVSFRIKLARSVRRAIGKGRHPKIRVDFTLDAGGDRATDRRALRLHD